MIWKSGCPHLKLVPILMVGMLKLSQNLQCNLLEEQVLVSYLDMPADYENKYSKSIQENISMWWPWSEREIWPNLKANFNSKTAWRGHARPPKLVYMLLTLTPTCMNFLS